MGLLVEEIVDIVESSVESELNSSGEGALGSLIIAGKATEMIDVGFYWNRAVNGQEAASGADPAKTVAVTAAAPDRRRLLVVDASPFSQLLLRPLLAQAGYDVTVAPDPMSALELYDAGEQFHLIMADTQCGGSPVQAFAKAFGRATNWHNTPLLELALRKASGKAEPVLDESTLLGAVSGALEGLKGAA